MIKLILIIVGVCFAIISKDFLYISLLINTSLLVIMYFNRHNVNVAHLCGGFFVIKLIEIIVMENFISTSSDTLSSMWVNTIIFSTQLLLDMVFFCFVVFRSAITRQILIRKDKSANLEHVFMYNAEFGFLSLFVVFMAVDFLAIIENIVRHKLFYLTPLYDNFETIKSILTGISFLLFWMMKYPIAQEKYIKRSK